MTEQVNASELLQKLLDERFEAGRQAMLNDLLDIIKAKMAPDEQVEPSVGSSLAADALRHRPALREALEYVEQHRGVTVAQAKADIRNKNALYRLRDLGFLEQRGPQFFPKNAQAGT